VGASAGAPRTEDYLRAGAPRESIGRGLLRSRFWDLCGRPRLFCQRHDLFQAFELRTIDLRFNIRGVREVKTPLAVIFIGDDSIDEFGRWPWSWDYHALLIDTLRRAGARYVLFDILFAEAPSRADAELLSAMTRQAGNVYFISYFTNIEVDSHERPGPLLLART